jgi:glycosyltransferase involved in cell wall biosynthesis
VRLIYLRPEFGGIRDYSESITTIFARFLPEIQLDIIDVPDHYLVFLPALLLALKLFRTKADAVYLELGSGSRSAFWATLLVINIRSPDLFITVHDPHVVIRGPFVFKAISRLPKPFPYCGSLLSRALNALLGRKAVEALLYNAKLLFCLSPTLKTVETVPVSYLPQPTYSDRPARGARDTSRNEALPNSGPLKVGFVGFWGPHKGLETFLEAIAILQDSSATPHATFFISGKCPTPGDPFCSSIRALLSRLDDRVVLPGFIAPTELTAFISSLDLIVLPYWPELPAASSGNVMRAMEAAVPIVATTTQSLQDQLGPDGAFYVPPKDPERLARAIQAALESPHERQRMALANRDRAYRDHSWELVGVALRRSLLSDTPSPPTSQSSRLVAPPAPD